jgi:hypothetical protein
MFFNSCCTYSNGCSSCTPRKDSSMSSDQQFDVAYISLTLPCAVVHDPWPDQHGSWRIKSVRLMNPNYPADVVDITKCLSEDDWHEVDRQLDLWADLPTTGDLDV